MMKPKKQIWRDNTEPPKNYIWVRLNESGSYLGTYEHNGYRWVKIRDTKSESGGSSSGTTCDCDGKFVYIKKTPEIVYATDKSGNQAEVKYSSDIVNNALVMRTSDGRLKSNPAKDLNDVVTLKDICWHE